MNASLAVSHLYFWGILEGNIFQIKKNVKNVTQFTLFKNEALHHPHDGSIEIITAKRQIANRTIDGFMPEGDLD